MRRFRLISGLLVGCLLMTFGLAGVIVGDLLPIGDPFIQKEPWFVYGTLMSISGALLVAWTIRKALRPDETSAIQAT